MAAFAATASIPAIPVVASSLAFAASALNLAIPVVVSSLVVVALEEGPGVLEAHPASAELEAIPAFAELEATPAFVLDFLISACRRLSCPE